MRQIEFRDMRVRLLGSFMTTNDTESALRRNDAIDECLANVLRYNHMLYAGVGGVDPVGQQDSLTVSCPLRWAQTARLFLLRVWMTWCCC